MFLFQFRNAVKKEEPQEVQKLAREAIEFLNKKNPDFASAVKGASPEESLRIAMSDKFRPDFRNAFLSVGGTEAQWNSFQLQFQQQDLARQRVENLEQEKTRAEQAGVLLTAMATRELQKDGREYADKIKEKGNEVSS